MLCQNCKMREGKPTKYTLNGVSTIKYLCPECNSKIIKSHLGNSFGAGFLSGITGAFSDVFSDAPDVFASFFDFYPIKNEKAYSSTAVCPHCKTTSEEFLRTGFVGCPHCYEAFAKIMKDIIKKCQPSDRHIGKAPKGLAETNMAILRLEAQLKKAIEEERYEDAVVINKEIEALREQLGNVKK